MKQIYLLLALLLFNLRHLAQPAYDQSFIVNPDVHYGHAGICTDASGNLYVLSQLPSGGGSVDIDPGPGTALVSAGTMVSFYFAKYSPSGAFVWAKTINSSYGAYPKTIKIRNSFIYIGANIAGAVDLDPGPGTDNQNLNTGAEATVLKFDLNGTYIWGRSQGNYSTCTDLEIDNSDAVYMSCRLNYTSSYYSSIIKFSASGGVSWNKLLATNPFGGGGSINGVVASALAVDNSGGLYVTGHFDRPIVGVPISPFFGSSEYSTQFLIKYDTAGAYITAAALCHSFYMIGVKLPGSDHSYNFCALDFDPVQNKIVLGGLLGWTFDFDLGPGTQTLANSGTNTTFLAAYSTSLGYLWGTTFNATGSGVEQNLALAFDNTGNTYCMTDLLTNSVSIGTSTVNRTGPGDNLLLCKFDNSGNTAWAGTIEANNTYALCTYPGYIYIRGGFAGFVDFDMGPGAQYLNGNAGSSFVVRYADCNAAPATPAAISGSTSLCENTSVSYSVAPVIGASSYSWSLPGGWTGVSTTTLLTALSGSASGSVQVSALNSCGSSTASALAVNINPKPAIPSAPGTTSACAGSSLVLNVTGIGSYSWTGPGGFNSSVQNPTLSNISVAAAGSYSVTQTVLGCISAAATTSLTVASLPSVSVNSGSICAGSTFTLVATGAASYNYSGGTNFVSPSTNTTYLVSGTSSVGCASSNTAAATITVVALPVVSVNSGSICAGQTFTIIANGASTYNYSSGSNLVSPSTNTSYLVSGTNSVGCASGNTVTASVTVAPLPLVSVNSGSICSGNTFTIVPTGASSYNYSSGSALVTPATHTTYLVSGTSSVGCASSNTAVVTVSVHPTPTIAVNSGSVCLGQTFTLQPSGTFSYNYPGGSHLVTPATNTTYLVSGTSSLGCSSNTVVATVSVMALPVVTISGPPSVCIGNTATLTSTGANSYLWSNNVSASLISVSPGATTLYSVTGTDGNGCKNTAQVTLTVHNLPQVTANATQSVLCSGDLTALSGGGAISYQWSGGVTNGVPFSPMVTAIYTVTGTDINTCQNTASILLTVNNLPLVSAQASSTVVCSGGTVSVSGGGASIYTWSGGITNNTPFNPTTSGTYTVTGKDLNNCQNTATISITVNSLPTLTVQNTAVICSGETATLSASGANLYSWNTGSTTPNISVTLFTTTNFTVTGTDLNGCTAVSIITQSVSSCTGFTTNESTAHNLSVYPNPFHGMVTVQAEAETDAVIIDALGKTVLSLKLKPGANSLDLSGQANGVYFLIGTFQARKIVKE